MSRSTVEDGPVSNIVVTHKGYEIDMNNFPGKLRSKLVKSGDLNPDSIGLPPNMPGKKLVELRKELRAKARESIKATGFTVGELVQYKDKTYTVEEIKGDKVVMKRPNPKGTGMVKFTVSSDKLSRVLAGEDNEEINEDED